MRKFPAVDFYEVLRTFALYCGLEFCEGQEERDFTGFLPLFVIESWLTTCNINSASKMSKRRGPEHPRPSVV